MTIAYDDIKCYQNLIYAIISRAMMDCFKPPIKGRIDEDTRSAIEFLFGDYIQYYLELVDIEPCAFKSRLKQSMWDDSSNINSTDKRAFRANYKIWEQHYKVPAMLKKDYK